MLNQFNVSLWGDEAFSAILSMKPVTEIVRIITRDTSPPLYNITEHFWFNIFGTSEVAIRSLSFLYFLIAVFFVYKIGSHFWNRKVGFLGAALTFLNPFFFTYAFEGRMYSILAATVVASMYFFLTKRWVLYVATTALALYSHHFAVFALFTQGLWFIYEYFAGERKIAISIFKSFVAVGILYLPWALPLYNQTKMVVGDFWLGTPTLTELRNLIYKYTAEGIGHPLAKPALYMSFSVLVLRVWDKDIRKTIFLLSWFLVPILTTFILSQKIQSIFYDRYLLYTIPALALTLASKPRKLSLIVLGLIMGLFLVIDINYFTHPTKRPFRELASYVKENKTESDFLLNWNSSAHHLWEAKYYQIPAPLYIPENKALPFYVGTALMTDEDIVSTIPQTLQNKVRSKRVGVITSGSVDEVELAGYTKNEVQIFGELKFIWLVKK